MGSFQILTHPLKFWRRKFVHCPGMRLTRFLVLRAAGLFPHGHQETREKPPGWEAGGTVDAPSSRGSCSILQTRSMWLLRPTPRLSFPGGGTLSCPWPDVTLHCAGGSLGGGCPASGRIPGFARPSVFKASHPAWTIAGTEYSVENEQ